MGIKFDGLRGPRSKNKGLALSKQRESKNPLSSPSFQYYVKNGNRFKPKADLSPKKDTADVSLIKGEYNNL